MLPEVVDIFHCAIECGDRLLIIFSSLWQTNSIVHAGLHRFLLGTIRSVHDRANVFQEIRRIPAARLGFNRDELVFDLEAPSRVGNKNFVRQILDRPNLNGKNFK